MCTIQLHCLLRFTLFIYQFAFFFSRILSCFVSFSTRNLWSICVYMWNSREKEKKGKQKCQVLRSPTNMWITKAYIKSTVNVNSIRLFWLLLAWLLIFPGLFLFTCVARSHCAHVCVHLPFGCVSMPKRKCYLYKLLLKSSYIYTWLRLFPLFLQR